jgi:orotate phosphoribosyltransferase
VDAPELGAALCEHAYLEGDFLLRSGRRSRYYLDKYRFETRPDLLGPLGERIAAVAREFEPEAHRLAGPELGAVALAASASLASGLPFLIVRKEAKGYGTGNRLEGLFEEGELVCLVEDVVTSGGAAVEAVEALRPGGGWSGLARARRSPSEAPLSSLRAPK